MIFVVIVPCISINFKVFCDKVCICWPQKTLIFIEMHGTTTTKKLWISSWGGDATELNRLRLRIRKVFSSNTGPDTGQFIFRGFIQLLIGKCFFT
jgi:hypothetical protein